MRSVFMVVILSLVLCSLLWGASYISWNEHTVTNDFSRPRSVIGTDIDQDGDIDILATSESNEEIAWWENDGTDDLDNWPEHVVVENVERPWDAKTVDMDLDGDLDIICTLRDNHYFLWFENEGNCLDFTRHQIETGNTPVSIDAADVDGDNDIDVVGSAYIGNTIHYFINNGNADNWTEVEVDTAFHRTNCITIVDLDGDGDGDFLASAEFDNEIAWWENNGTNNADHWEKHVLDTDFSRANCVKAVDMDNDGDLDVVGSAEGTTNTGVSWWENDGTNNEDNWIRHIVCESSNNRYISPSDINGDGDIDIVVINASRVYWWENMNDGNDTWIQHDIRHNFSEAKQIHAIDIDNDGDEDIIGSARSLDQISCWENSETFEIEMSLEYLGTDPEDPNIWTMDIYLDVQELNGVPLENASLSCMVDRNEAELNIPEELLNQDELIIQIPNEPFRFYSNNGNFSRQKVQLTINGFNGLEFLDVVISDSVHYSYASNGTHPFGFERDDFNFTNTDISLEEWSEYLEGISESWPIKAPVYLLSSLLDNSKSCDGRSYGMSLAAAYYFATDHFKPEGFQDIETYEMSLDEPVIYADIMNFHLSQLWNIEMGNDFRNMYQEIWYGIRGADFLNVPVIAFRYLDQDGNEGYHAVIPLTAFDFKDREMSRFGIYEVQNGNFGLYEFDYANERMTATLEMGDETVVWEILEADIIDPYTRIDNRETGINLNYYISDQAFEFLNDGYQWLGLTTPVNAFIEDASGRQTGYLENGNFVNDFPGVEVYRIPSYNANNDSLTTFLIPDGEEYTLYAHGYNEGILSVDVIRTLHDLARCYSYSGIAVNENSIATLALTYQGVLPVVENDLDGNGTTDETYEPFDSYLVSVDEEPSLEIPLEYEIITAYPNPFNPSTTIGIGLPGQSQLKVEVFDILGRHVDTLADASFSGGYHNFQFNAADKAGGIYFISVSVPGEFSRTQKVLFIK